MIQGMRKTPNARKTAIKSPDRAATQTRVLSTISEKKSVITGRAETQCRQRPSMQGVVVLRPGHRARDSGEKTLAEIIQPSRLQDRSSLVGRNEPYGRITVPSRLRVVPQR